MSSISFQERGSIPNGIPIYSPFGTVLKKDLFSSFFRHRTTKVYEPLIINHICLITKVLGALHKGFIFPYNVKVSDRSMGCVFPGLSLIDLASKPWVQHIHEIYGSIIRSPIKMGFPYHVVLGRTQEISIRFRLNQKVNRIFREIHIGLIRSEYSHKNSFPPTVFWGQGIYASFPLSLYFPYFPRNSTMHQPYPRFKMNCYGFVWEVVCSTHIKAGEELKTKMQELSDEQGIPVSLDGIPCPFNLAAIFKQPDLNYWMRIQKLEEIEAGDIMVYLPPNHDPSCPADWEKPTGTHVMLVHAKGKKEGKGMQFFIIDSTRKPHCQEDSRYSLYTGIGKAPLTLIPKDEEKGIYVLQWGSNEKQRVKEVVIGRIVGENTVTV